MNTAIFAFPGNSVLSPKSLNLGLQKVDETPVIDMGPYYLAALVNLLGPAKVAPVYLLRAKKRTIGVGPKKGKKLK